MAVKVRVRLAEGQELTAAVDRDNNWNVPDEDNRWAYGVVDAFPGSVILSGLYRLRRERHGPLTTY